jgi:ABC-type transport system involved in cytochrome c biogenesis permease subunit
MFSFMYIQFYTNFLLKPFIILLDFPDIKFCSKLKNTLLMVYLLILPSCGLMEASDKHLPIYTFVNVLHIHSLIILTGFLDIQNSLETLYSISLSTEP